MNYLIENPKMRVALTTNLEAGWFGIFQGQRPIHWENCRERFHRLSIKDLSDSPSQQVEFLFSCINGTAKNVATFINLIETKNLKHKLISNFQLTNSKRILVVKPAKFWYFKPLRFSLFTALLRSGIRYDPTQNNFSEALDSCDYIKETKHAVEHFLSGNTWPAKKYSASQWYQTFYHNKQLDRALTKKPISLKIIQNFVYQNLKTTESEFTKAILAQGTTDECLLEYALSLLKTDKNGLINSYHQHIANPKNIWKKALKYFGHSYSEAVELYKKSKKSE